MDQLTPTQKAFAALAEFEKLDAAWGKTSIDATSGNIRGQFAAAGVKVDHELDIRIKAAVIRANRIGAEKSLAEFEKLDAAWGKTSIDATSGNIRGQFAAAGVKVDHELDIRIKAAVIRANRIGAEKSLAEFEKLDAAWGKTSIDATSGNIRGQFAAAGVKVDHELDIRIKAAVIRANRIGAEKSLAEFEKLDAAWGKTSIDATSGNIRGQFAAGGIELTNEGKLPNGLEARLNSAVTRAQTISAKL